MTQFSSLAKQVAEEFAAARGAALPASLLADEAALAHEEALKGGDLAREAVRLRFVQIFQRRLTELWHRWWLGLPEFWSNTEEVEAWQAGVLGALERHRRIAPSERAIAIYEFVAAQDRTLTVTYDRPSLWRQGDAVLGSHGAIYGLQIPVAFVAPGLEQGKVALLDAKPHEDWRPPPGGCPALIAVSPVWDRTTIVQWFGYLDNLGPLDAVVRQSADSSISTEISRSGTVIHPVTRILD